MSLDYSPAVLEPLRVKLEETDFFKAIRANESDFASMQLRWVVEYAREGDGVLEAGFFGYEAGTPHARPNEHIHLTVHPDKSETTVRLQFALVGRDRMKITHRRRGEASPN
jgi:hypothetical protein